MRLSNETSAGCTRDSNTVSSSQRPSSRRAQSRAQSTNRPPLMLRVNSALLITRKCSRTPSKDSRFPRWPNRHRSHERRSPHIWPLRALLNAIHGPHLLEWAGSLLPPRSPCENGVLRDAKMRNTFIGKSMSRASQAIPGKYFDGCKHKDCFLASTNSVRFKRVGKRKPCQRPLTP